MRRLPGRILVNAGHVHKNHITVQDFIQQEIAAEHFWGSRCFHVCDDDGFHAVFAGAGRSLAPVVGLDAAEGHKGGVAVIFCLLYQIVQFSQLISAKTKTG